MRNGDVELLASFFAACILRRAHFATSRVCDFEATTILEMRGEDGHEQFRTTGACSTLGLDLERVEHFGGYAPNQ